MPKPQSPLPINFDRVGYKPSKEFAKQAHIGSASELVKINSAAAKNIEKFWAAQADTLVWQKPYREILRWKHPRAEWFVGGKLNVSENCLDVHLQTWRKNKAAIIWESEDGNVRTLTYQQLHSEVCKAANALKGLGVKPNDVVAIYMGMVPEAIIAMQACARIGAIHNVVFGGFSSEALRERINDSKATVLITQDGALRRNEILPLKKTADEAIKKCPSIQHVLVVQRTGLPTSLARGRDIWWHEALAAASTECAPTSLPSEHPLFILYTSGSTGKPKGILHTSAGYITQVKYTTNVVFDMKDTDVYFCTADVGWITGHSYVAYGPLACGATILLYEGGPMCPTPGRFWELIDKHRVTIFYTAPTAIRAFMKAGDSWPLRHKLDSLRLLGTVGEPINPEAWRWYHSLIGRERCPIVDTWWQTETGSIMISPIPGATTTFPGTATKPLPGLMIDVVRKDGSSCKVGEGGLLVIKHPWPSMARTIFGDFSRYVKTYWSEFPKTKDCSGWYFTGDGAKKDKLGNIWIIGRVDDVVNVSGHRLGTAEIESALVGHKTVAEAAVVARRDDIKGNVLVAFVTLRNTSKKLDLKKLQKELKDHVGEEIGRFAAPNEIRFAEALPKTRSGKIMRRLLREIVSGNTITGDTSTLEDFSVLEHLRFDEE
ncbi:MAG: acetate--CoA ligase [Ignavibacteria bacterium]|nr:acetate--CoA ligase [Ignavibacteria bacterium]